jgi:glutaminyl-peptide cyclotransferase
MPRLRRRLAAAVALLAAAGCSRGDPALGQHIDHPDFPADAAWVFVTDQVSTGPRYAGTRSHDRTLRWLVDQLSFRADTVVLDSFPFVTAEGKRVVMTNVFARFRPEEPRRILLVTHWDTHPKAVESADPFDRHRPVAGANVGASGTALLVALAEAFRQQPPPVGVDLLFTDGDDFAAEKLLGTERFLAGRPEGYRPAFAIVFDAVADRAAWLPQDAASRRAAPQVVHRVWGVARQMGRDSVFVAEGVADQKGPHALFSAAGIPAVRVWDPELGPGNSHWHTINDLPSNASRETLALVGEVITEVVYRGIPEARP